MMFKKNLVFLLFLFVLAATPMRSLQGADQLEDTENLAQYFETGITVDNVTRAINAGDDNDDDDFTVIKISTYLAKKIEAENISLDTETTQKLISKFCEYAENNDLPALKAFLNLCNANFELKWIQDFHTKKDKFKEDLELFNYILGYTQAHCPEYKQRPYFLQPFDQETIEAIRTIKTNSEKEKLSLDVLEQYNDELYILETDYQNYVDAYAALYFHIRTIQPPKKQVNVLPVFYFHKAQELKDVLKATIEGEKKVSKHWIKAYKSLIQATSEYFARELQGASILDLQMLHLEVLWQTSSYKNSQKISQKFIDQLIQNIPHLQKREKAQHLLESIKTFAELIKNQKLLAFFYTSHTSPASSSLSEFEAPSLAQSMFFDDLGSNQNDSQKEEKSEQDTDEDLAFEIEVTKKNDFDISTLEEPSADLEEIKKELLAPLHTLESINQATTELNSEWQALLGINSKAQNNVTEEIPFTTIDVDENTFDFIVSPAQTTADPDKKNEPEETDADREKIKEERLKNEAAEKIQRWYKKLQNLKKAKLEVTKKTFIEVIHPELETTTRDEKFEKERKRLERGIQSLTKLVGEYAELQKPNEQKQENFKNRIQVFKHTFETKITEKDRLEKRYQDLLTTVETEIQALLDRIEAITKELEEKNSATTIEEEKGDELKEDLEEKKEEENNTPQETIESDKKDEPEETDEDRKKIRLKNEAAQKIQHWYKKIKQSQEPNETPPHDLPHKSEKMPHANSSETPNPTPSSDSLNSENPKENTPKNTTKIDENKNINPELPTSYANLLPSKKTMTAGTILGLICFDAYKQKDKITKIQKQLLKTKKSNSSLMAFIKGYLIYQKKRFFGNQKKEKQNDSANTSVATHAQ